MTGKQADPTKNAGKSIVSFSMIPSQKNNLNQFKVRRFTGGRYFQGLDDILIIAPHGPVIDGQPRNDWNTGLIAESVARQLECCALINDKFLKPEDGEEPSYKKKRLDLNLIRQTRKHKYYSGVLFNFYVKSGGVFVVHIHGCENENAETEAALSIEAGKYKIEPSDVQVLVGFGQGAHPGKNNNRKYKNSSYSLPRKKAKKFSEILTRNGLPSILVRNDAPNYRGRHYSNMNQYFRGKKDSVQLEIKERGCRDTPENIQKTASAIAKSIAQMIRPLEDQILPEVPKDIRKRLWANAPEKKASPELVAEALQELMEIFAEHFHRAMVDAGLYIIETFYGSDPYRVLQNKPIKSKSLNQLIIELQQHPGKVPSKSWFYNAVNLAAQEIISEEKSFQTFGNLGLSHKLKLLHVPNLKQIKSDRFDEVVNGAFQEKERLAKIAIDEGLSVRDFGARIRIEHPDKQTALDLTALPPKQELRQQKAAELRRLYNLAIAKRDESQKSAWTYGKALSALGAVLAESDGEIAGGKGRFQDWTDSKNNINICTGCRNDCLYCYMKPINNGKSKRKQPKDWYKWELRQKDVDAKQRLRDGLVGFPSSHDIFPEILDAYLEVLGKILRTGNEVLIVSKPRLDCIEAICDASIFFKDKILFRFTIGAMDDDILSFWEPNAPAYNERKACLSYAKEHGFRTSVSMEPMLDTPQIEATVADLTPLVTEDIWLGMMSHLKGIENWDNKEGFDNRKQAIEIGQTPPVLTAIYETYRDNPKIKWKTETLKVIIEHQK